jgi:hypothetical protein
VKSKIEKFFSCGTNRSLQIRPVSCVNEIIPAFEKRDRKLYLFRYRPYGTAEDVYSTL